MLLIYFVIEIDFFHTRSYFVPATKNPHLTRIRVISQPCLHTLAQTPIEQRASAYYPNYYVIYIYIYIELSYHICGKLEVAFKASPSPQHQHCTDEDQKAETVLSAVIYIAHFMLKK